MIHSVTHVRPHDPELRFPYLASRNVPDHRKQVILVTGVASGGCLTGTDINGVAGELGEYSDRWPENLFHVFHGKVTLSNKGSE